MSLLYKNTTRQFRKGGLLYSTKDLVKFGNFLLSSERKKMVSKHVRDSVGHWDLSNYLDSDNPKDKDVKLKKASE